MHLRLGSGLASVSGMGPHAISVLMAVASPIVLIWFVVCLAHARLLDADLEQLQHLYEQQLLTNCSSMDEAFESITVLLDCVAGVRPKRWMVAYYHLLKATTALAARFGHIETVAWLRDELHLLVGCCAEHYQQVCQRAARRLSYPEVAALL